MALRRNENERTISMPGVLMILFGSCFLFAFQKFPTLRKSLSFSTASSLSKLATILIVLGIILILGNYLKIPGFRGRKKKFRKTVIFPRQGLVYLAMMQVMLLGALLGHANLLLLIFALMAGVFIVNGGTIYSMLQKLKVKRILPDTVAAGQTFSVQLALTNEKRIISSRIMEVTDSFNDGKTTLKAEAFFAYVPPGNTEHASYQLRLNKRGKYSFDTIKISSRYPLGIVERGIVFHQPDELLVFPRIGRLSLTWKNMMRNDQEVLKLRNRRKGVHEDEFHQIREYRQGDNPRAIHWTSTAKHAEIMVREFHENRESNLDIILDLRVSGKADQQQDLRVELAISFVATILSEQVNSSSDIKLKIAVLGKNNFYWTGHPSTFNLKNILTNLAEAEACNSEDSNGHSLEKNLQISFDDRVLVVTTRKKGSVEWDQLFSELNETQILQGNSHMVTVEADPEVIQNYFSLPPI